MEEITSQAPLWLDIKPQYIDENFDRVVDYLQNQAANANDSFYKVTVALLEKRVEELLQEQYAMPLSREEAMPEQNLSFAVKLVAAYLMIGTEKCKAANWFAQVYILLLKNLLPLVSKDVSTDLISLSLDVLNGKVSEKMPFSWNDIKGFTPDIFSHKVINLTEKIKCSRKGDYDNKGFLNLDGGNVHIIPYSRQTAARVHLVPSITAFNERFALLSVKDDKVKHTELGNIDVLGTFTKRFVQTQRQATVPVKRLKEYDNKELFKVRVLSKEGFRVKLQSIDPDYETVTGYLSCDGLSRLGFYEMDFYRSLQQDDIIKVKKGKGASLDMSDDVKTFIVECRTEVNEEYNAVVMSLQPDSRGRDKIYLWTSGGFPAQCFLNQCELEEVHVGDYVNVTITGYGRDNYYGVVNVKVTSMSEEMIDRDVSIKNMVEDMVYGTYENSENDDSSVLPSAIKSIISMLVRHQRVLPQPSERYRLLCVARALTELVDLKDDSDYIAYLAAYLENLVHFAKGNYDKIVQFEPSQELAHEEAVIRRMQIVEILMAYGNDSHNDRLEEIIKESNDDLLQKIAILVQSCNRIDDVISKAMQNVIKREITKYLAVETEGETDLEEENGSYLGIENSRQEFKTSFFHAPASAKEQRQEVNIFKGVCAFLNSQAGGTLYLGVNDLGYVNGIQDDLEWLDNRVLGAYSGIDGYMRYITDRAKHYFGLGVTTHIEINALYDNQVIALNIQPYEYNIVELEGTAYLRLNNESVTMTDAMKRQVMGRRINGNTDSAANITKLKEAIADSRKVVLRNYSSSNSSTISDRNVEPYAFTENYKQIWCYDLDKNENRVFNTSRIGSVQILEEKFTYASKHNAGNLDVFGMTGDTPIKISLMLDMMAHNILIEEYPHAKKFIKATDNSSRWILDTEVYKIEGIGRFYIGLAEHINILDAPELKAYAQEYKRFL